MNSTGLSALAVGILFPNLCFADPPHPDEFGRFSGENRDGSTSLPAKPERTPSEGAPESTEAGATASPPSASSNTPKLPDWQAPHFALKEEGEAHQNEHRRWWGYQTFLSDGASVAVAVVSLKEDSGAGVVLGGLFLLAGSPLVHLAHHRGDKAAVSFVVRLLAVPTGSGIIVAGFTARCGLEHDEPCNRSFPLAAGVTLLAVPVILDAAFIANEWVPDAARRPSASGISLSVSPAIDVKRRTVEFGVRGTF
jgi:hypothetical protein